MTTFGEGTRRDIKADDVTSLLPHTSATCAVLTVGMPQSFKMRKAYKRPGMIDTAFQHHIVFEPRSGIFQIERNVPVVNAVIVNAAGVKGLKQIFSPRHGRGSKARLLS